MQRNTGCPAHLEQGDQLLGLHLNLLVLGDVVTDGGVMSQVHLDRVGLGLAHLASLLYVELLGGDKEDAIADVEHEDHGLKADAADSSPKGIHTPHYSSYDCPKHQSDQLTRFWLLH